MASLMDKIWLLGETPGSHHAVKGYKLPGVNKMTPIEGLEYFGVRNLCRMKMRSDMGMTYMEDPCIVDDKGVMDKLCLTLVGSCAWRPKEGCRDDMDELLEIAKRDKRFMAAINDDFFSADRPEIYTPEVLRQQRYELHNWFEKPIEFWSVVYEREHIKGTDVLPWTMEYDLTTLWVWYSENVAELQDHLEWGKKLTKDGRVILGVYMYDYGNGCPISDDRMKRQLDFTYEKLVKGEIEGAMLHSSCNMDIGLNSTLITKEWLEALK